MLRRNAEAVQIAHDGAQFVKAGIEERIPSPVRFQCVEHGGVRRQGEKLQDFIGLFRLYREIVRQNAAHFLRADFLQLVDCAHDVGGFLRQFQHGIEAVQNFAVVHADVELLQTQRGKCAIDNRGNFRFIDNRKRAVADDVDVRLIELAETPALCPFAAVDFANLVAAEREGKFVAVQGDILGKGDGQIKAQGQIGVSLLETVNLFFRLAAALG